MISASVELCETEVCFLHIQLTGTNVRLPKMHKTPPDVDFESSRSPAKSESWNNPSLHCCCMMNVWDQMRQAFVTRCYRPHDIMSPNTSQILTFQTIWEQTADSSPTDSFSSLNWWSSMHGVATLYNCWVVFRKFHTFLCVTFHVIGPRRCCFCINPWSSGR